MADLKPIPKGVVRIYACGGAAINIVEDIPNLQINPDLLADFKIVQLDTSKSNVTARASNVENYMLPDVVKVDGGGKNRKENEELIKQHAKPAIKAHPPGDLNIIVSTGGGSTGSVFAPALAIELYARGEAVIILLIGTTSSRVEATNTLSTRRNYQQIAKARGVPVIMNYLQNSAKMPREQVNRQMLSTIQYLGILFSRRNAEMDTMDLRNWLNFIKPELTKGLFPAQVYSLTILLSGKSAEGEEKFINELDMLGNILSVATLARRGVSTDLPEGFLPEYQAPGFAPELKDSRAFDDNTVNYLITDGLYQAQTDALNEIAGTEKPKVAVVSTADDGDEDDVSFS